MEPLEKKVLQKTITYFTENGANVDALLRRLVEDDIISSEDEEAIGHLTTTQQKFYQIYSQAQRRPYFKKFVLALRQTGNDHVADKIMEMYNAKPGTAPDSSQCAGNPVQSPGDDFKRPQLPSDFLITENGVASIVDVLKEPGLGIEHSWTTIQEVLLSPARRRSLEENNLGVLILKTLKFWISDGNGNTTFEKLHDFIKDANAPAAGALLTNKESIRAKCT